MGSTANVFMISVRNKYQWECKMTGTIYTPLRIAPFQSYYRSLEESAFITIINRLNCSRVHVLWNFGYESR
jgi:hypothetical protein